MPWRGPAYPGEVPTLGWGALAWVTEFLVVPDGPHRGDPLVLTDEQAELVLRFYALDERGGRLFRRAMVSRPKGWGKSPLLAALCAFEAVGPARFGGWNADGDPVGAPWPTPWVQIAAVSEDQTDNTYSLLVEMLTEGSAADVYGLDVGQTRTFTGGGGRIEPVTSSSGSREGQRVTFCVLDEALALDTFVPTPGGWTTVADLEAGAELFTADGTVTRVIGTTQVQYGRECYRVTFADGTSVVTSDGHLWHTRVRSSAALARVRSTGEMVADGRTFRTPRSRAFRTESADLPVDPYVLGVWLGDGSTGQMYVTAGDQDVDAIARELVACGVPARPNRQRDRAWRIALSHRGGYQAAGRPEFAKALQALPCYRDKHIPDAYLRGSIAQRTALLQGLMDTDGHITRDGHCAFVGTAQLAGGVVELLRTLGQVPRRIWRPDARSRKGGYCKVHFTPKDGLVPFRLERKRARVRDARRSPDWVTIVDISPVASVPVKCVEVDDPSHLFVAGEGCHVTHNTHLWTPRNGGARLAATVRRNTAKMSGATFETTNAFKPGENSVAEKSHDAALKLSPGLLVDHREPTRTPSLRNKAELRRALREVYGDARRWVDLERILAEIEDPATDPDDAKRYYLNLIVAGSDKAFDAKRWHAAGLLGETIPDGRLVTVGFDGSKFDDATAIVVTDVEDGFQQLAGCWERPEDAGDDYEVDSADVDLVMSDVFGRYDVWRAYCDPPYWETQVDAWAGRWGDKRVVRWYTHRRQPAAHACRAFATAIRAGSLSHNADPALTAHVGNAHRRQLQARDGDGKPLWVIGKDRPGSPRKIDAAMAAVLSWEARGDAIASGATKRRRHVTVGF